MRVARDKAAMMVAAVGAELGPVLNIDEYQPMRRPLTPNTLLGRETPASLSGKGSAGLLPGMMDVSVTVFVTFAIE